MGVFYLENTAEQTKLKPKKSKSTKIISNANLWLIIAVVVFAILPASLNGYQIHILDLVVLYFILAIGLDLSIGFCGQINLAQAAFYAVGAYTSAILTAHYHVSFWISLPASMIVGALFGVLIGLPSLRVRSHYLAIATLGLAVALNEVLVNLGSFTGGPNGITGIPKPEFFGISLGQENHYYYLVLAIAIILVLFSKLITEHSIGRSFRAVRDDHVAAQALGINVAKQQIMAFGLSGLYAGAAGALYASMLSYVSPDSFSLNEMFLLLTIVVIGGMGNIYGSMLGVVILIVGREFLASFPSVEQVIYGALVVLLVVFLPGGLISIPSLFQSGSRSRRRLRLPFRSTK